MKRFNTNDPSAGYLGDIGQGGPPYPPFSFQVPASSNCVLVVMSRATNLVCNSYSLELFGLPCPAPTLAIPPEGLWQTFGSLEINYFFTLGVASAGRSPSTNCAAAK